jgi:hypothetical protein
MEHQQLYKNWGDLPLSVYKELLEIRTTEWENVLQEMIEECSLFRGISPDDEFFNELTFDQLHALYSEMSWSRNSPAESLKEKIQIGELDLKLIDFNTISFGAFIDCSHYFKDLKENLHIVLAILYRKTKNDEWGNELDEPYRYNLLKRSELFKEFSTSLCFGVISEYRKWHEDLVKNYPNIFEPEGWDEIEGEDQLDPEEVVQIRKEIEQEKKKAPFSWLGIVWELAKHDVSRFDAVFNTPVILVFNTLSMKKALGV